MNDYTLTTEEVRGLWVVTMFKRITSGANRNLTTYRDEFDRWLDQVKAEAWDEGFTAGVNHDLGNWENAPAIINNPYRQEKN